MFPLILSYWNIFHCTEVEHEFIFDHMDAIVSSCVKSCEVLWLSKGSTGCPQRVILVGHSFGRKQKVESTKKKFWKIIDPIKTIQSYNLTILQSYNLYFLAVIYSCLTTWVTHIIFISPIWVTPIWHRCSPSSMAQMIQNDDSNIEFFSHFIFSLIKTKQNPTPKDPRDSVIVYFKC